MMGPKVGMVNWMVPKKSITVDGASESAVTLNGKLDSGEYRLILDGEGQYTFEVTVNRTIPHEFGPAIIGSMLLIWGIWRKQQEEDALSPISIPNRRSSDGLH